MLYALLMVLGGGGTIVLGVVALLARQQGLGTVMLVLGPLIILLIPITALVAPLRYLVSPTEVIIRRVASNVRLPLSGVAAVEPIEYEHAFRSAVRTFGSGGAFGIYGRFHSPAMGEARVFATRRSNLVLLRMGSRAASGIEDPR